MKKYRVLYLNNLGMRNKCMLIVPFTVPHTMDRESLLVLNKGGKKDSEIIV